MASDINISSTEGRIQGQDEGGKISDVDSPTADKLGQQGGDEGLIVPGSFKQEQSAFIGG